MASDPIGYVTVTWNQASGQPDLETCGMYPDPEDARTERDDLRAQTAQAGRGERHEVCAVVPLEGDEVREVTSNG